MFSSVETVDNLFFFMIKGDRDCAEIQDYMLQLTGGRTVPRVFIKGKAK